MDKVAVGSRIRALRQDRGWSQTEFGQKIGKTQPVIQKWEAGINGMSVDAMQRVADLFGVPVSWLTEAGRSSDPATANLKASNPMVDSARQVLRMFGYEAISRQEYEAWQKVRGLVTSTFPRPSEEGLSQNPDSALTQMESEASPEPSLALGPDNPTAEATMSAPDLSDVWDLFHLGAMAENAEVHFPPSLEPNPRCKTDYPTTPL